MVCVRSFIGIAALCLAGLSSQSAAGQSVLTSPIPAVPEDCNFSEPARKVTLLRQMPEVVTEFKRQRLSMVDADGSFTPIENATETEKQIPNLRFLRAYIFYNRAVVWFYGVGFANVISAGELRKIPGDDKLPPALHITGTVLGGPLCVATQAILDGIRSDHRW